MANVHLTLSGTSPAAPGTVAGAILSGMDEWDSLVFYWNCQGATGGTLNVYLQTSYDGGTHWVDIAQPTTQFAGGASATSKVFQLSQSAVTTTPVTVGTDLSPAIATTTVLGGCWGDKLRIVYVAGAGTTLGAVQNIYVVGTRANSRA